MLKVKEKKGLTPEQKQAELKKIAENTLKKQDKIVIDWLDMVRKQLKDNLIIICDPKDDALIASYRDSVINTRIRNREGKNEHLIKDLMSYSKVNKSVNNFLLWVDGAVFGLAQDQRDKRQKKGRFSKQKGQVNN